MENLSIQNMAKSVKDTEEQPGKNVAQKSGLNKAILQQCWGLLAMRLAYKLAGEIIWVAAQCTSQRCCSCGYTHEDNRDGKRFLCRWCVYTNYADCNASANIEDAGLKKLDGKATHGHSRPLKITRLARQSRQHPFYRGVWTWRVLVFTPLRNIKYRLGNHVPSFSGVTCNVLPICGTTHHNNS